LAGSLRVEAVERKRCKIAFHGGNHRGIIGKLSPNQVG
jgi:hypothetical protein